MLVFLGVFINLGLAWNKVYSFSLFRGGIKPPNSVSWGNAAPPDRPVLIVSRVGTALDNAARCSRSLREFKWQISHEKGFFSRRRILLVLPALPVHSGSAQGQSSGETRAQWGRGQNRHFVPFSALEFPPA